MYSIELNTEFHYSVLLSPIYRRTIHHTPLCPLYTDAPFITHLKTYPEMEELDPKVSEGENLTMWCAAHGNPPPKYTWSFTRTKVHSADYLYVEIKKLEK